MAELDGRKLEATFGTQARALFSKNAAQQKRAWKTNLFIISTPLVFCVLLLILQILINKALDSWDNKCGCECLECCYTAQNGSYICQPNSESSPCQTWMDCNSYNTSNCGLRYSNGRQAAFCPVESPSSWPALLQVPNTSYRAEPWRPNATYLYTGQDPALADSLAGSMFPPLDPGYIQSQYRAALEWFQQSDPAEGSIYLSALSLLGITLGSWQKFPFRTYLLEPAFVSSNIDDNLYKPTLYVMVPDASDPDVQTAITTLNTLVANASFGSAQGTITFEAVTAQAVRNASADDINRQLWCGYRQARCDGTSQINEIAQAYDFQSSAPQQGRFSALMWYNATGMYGREGGAPPYILRVNQGLNKATNAFLQAAFGVNSTSNRTAQLLGVMDFPKGGSELSLDFSSLLGPLFFDWLCQLLLPLMLVNLVYEKQMRLRTMMKMHGLGDAAYWAIQYTWFLALNFVYTWVLIGFGSAINLSFFRKTSYSLQFVFYFLWNNCLVAFAFLLSTLFTYSKTAVVVTFLYVFGTGLVGLLLLEQFVSQDHWWVIFLEIIPGFGLYRGLYEIAQYAFRAVYQKSSGLTWSNLGDPNNGMVGVMVIFAIEWPVFLLLAWYLEQVLNTGIGVPRHPLFFLGKRFSGAGSGGAAGGRRRRGKSADEAVEVQVEAEDVRRERLRVEALLQHGPPTPASPPTPPPGGAGQDGAGGGGGGSPGALGSPGGSMSERLSQCSIVVHDMWKVFPPAGGKGNKVAVRGLSLAVERGECFGLLGPNGAGKSTTINILTGFLEPTEGTAWVEGYDIRGEMGAIYSLMGVCPQDNLLWEALTAREHLQFYGRLKNLQGAELGAAIESALRSVNLWHGGVADKRVGAYSGGMKRRLSVAISFMGRPRVVYLDEPSTGLDPASRHNLWDVVKQAKEDRGIILTTHSMEEASVLCDRLGIFVDGQLVCIGNPKELTARYGGYLVFTITTPVEEEEAADALVLGLAPGARLTYSLAGTRKYELPADQVTLAGVFDAMEAAAGRLTVLDWGVANATLEEVFVKFAKSIGAEGGN